MWDYFDQNQDEELLREEELEEAEKMVRNGSSLWQIKRRRFSTLGESDIYKMYRKYGMDPNTQEEDFW